MYTYGGSHWLTFYNVFLGIYTQYIKQTTRFVLSTWRYSLPKIHVMSLVSAFLGSVFDMQISIHIIEIEQPIDE